MRLTHLSCAVNAEKLIKISSDFILQLLEQSSHHRQVTARKNCVIFLAVLARRNKERNAKSLFQVYVYLERDFNDFENLSKH